MSHVREIVSKPLVLSIGVLAARLSWTSGVKKASTPLRIRAQAKPITNSGEGRCSVLLTVWHAALGTSTCTCSSHLSQGVIRAVV